MINKKKILKEIIENDSSFIGKEKELEELIELLIKNNPQIKADIEFKKKLKEKLDTFIIENDKSIRKLSIFTGFINAISVAFIIGGFYYFFSNVDFFHNQDGKLENINSDSVSEITQEIEDIFNNKLEEVIEIKKEQIEDTQITDLLGEVITNDIVQEETFSQASMLKMGGGDLNTERVVFDMDDSVTIEEENINNFEQEIAFEEFCKDNYGENLIIDGIKICIVEGKICIENNYDNGICNFDEIK